MVRLFFISGIFIHLQTTVFITTSIIDCFRNADITDEAVNHTTTMRMNDTLATGTTPEFSFAQNMSVFPPAKHDALGLSELLTPQERDVQRRVREFAERDVAPIIAAYWERAEFPFELVPGLTKLNIGGGNLQGYGCQGHSLLSCAMAAVELARVDGSVSTFFLVHTFLAELTIGLLGSEAQKREFLPDVSHLIGYVFSYFLLYFLLKRLVPPYFTSINNFVNECRCRALRKSDAGR